MLRTQSLPELKTSKVTSSSSVSSSATASVGNEGLGMVTHLNIINLPRAVTNREVLKRKVTKHQLLPQTALETIKEQQKLQGKDTSKLPWDRRLAWNSNGLNSPILDRYANIRSHRHLLRHLLAWRDFCREFNRLRNAMIRYFILHRLKKVFHIFHLQCKRKKELMSKLWFHFMNTCKCMFILQYRCIQLWKHQSKWMTRKMKRCKLLMRALKINRLTVLSIRLKFSRLVLDSFRKIAATTIQRRFRRHLAKYRIICNIRIKKFWMKRKLVWLLHKRKQQEYQRKLLEDECFESVVSQLMQIKSLLLFLEVVSCIVVLCNKELRISLRTSHRAKQHVIGKYDEENSAYADATKRAAIEELRPFIWRYFRRIFPPLYTCTRCVDTFIYKCIRKQHCNLCCRDQYGFGILIFQQLSKDSRAIEISEKIMGNTFHYDKEGNYFL